MHPPTTRTQEQSKAISKPEDYIVRHWIKRTYGKKIPQWALWKMTPAEAVDYLQEFDRGTFAKLTEADIIQATRRE